MSAAMLEVQGIAAGYGATSILHDISFSVPAAGRLAILGRNGMGKSTLLATLMGQTRRLGGSIKMDDDDISNAKTSDRALKGLGYVPQARCIFPSLTVEENLFVGLKGNPRASMAESYQLFPRLWARRKILGGQLSGGEQQMLSTARSLLGKPRVLLMDEPLEGLAPLLCDELIQVFKTLAQSGEMTILLVEQGIQRALEFADRVMVLERGRIAWTGRPAALAADTALIDRLLGVGGLH